MDGDTSASSMVTYCLADRVVVNDAGHKGSTNALTDFVFTLNLHSHGQT